MPAALTKDLILARPELWPQQCKVLRDFLINGEKLTTGAVYPVFDLRPDGVVVEMGSGATALLRFDETDVIEAVNVAYEKFSPEQRALDVKALTVRADLWPKKVTLRRKLVGTSGDKELIVSKGTEMDLGAFDGSKMWARDSAADWTPLLALWDTDFVGRARAALDAKVKSTGHRVLLDLDGKLVNLKTGKKAKLSPTNPPEFTLLYFSAGWCGPCRKYSPQLVSFYQQSKRDAGKRFEIIWVSRDRSLAEMQEYAKAEEFPWLCVPWDKLKEVPVAQAYGHGGIPDLVLLDAKGAVIASSYVGEKYQGPAEVVKVLTERLKTPK